MLLHCAVFYPAPAPLLCEARACPTRFVRFPKRMTLPKRMALGLARQHGEKQGLCGRCGLRGGLLAVGTPPPHLAAASARARADWVGSGDRWAITTELRASVHCNGRLWALDGRACSSLWDFADLCGPWWGRGGG
eukprot:3846208-Prymnesium_polylepis.2